MPAQLSPKDLETVRLIVNNGSLTETARLLHVSQPAISQRLANIEDRVGTELFIRRNGSMHTTPVADRLAAAAVSIDRVMSHAIDDVHSLIGQREQQLRITTQCHTCYRWLSFVIREMLGQYPDLHVDVIPEAVEDPYGAIERNEVDIALIYHVDASSPLVPLALFDDELFAVMRHDHPLATRKYLNAENFRDEALLLYTGHRHAFVDQVLHPAGVMPARLRQVRMTEAIVELARAGQGIAVLAGWVLNDLESKHELTAVRITRSGYKRRWQALVSEQCSREHANRFVELVKKNRNGDRDGSLAPTPGENLKP